MMFSLRSKLGDFWFYSAMMFVASRIGDVINIFVGLWLVPKYVGPGELGAVMPLTAFASFLALPMGVFATTFLKEVTTLANRGEYGKLKTLVRGVFLAIGVFLVFAILLSQLLMPLFLERIRIVKGSLGILIIACGFVGTASPVYTSALQALKKFTAMSLIGVLCAPVRLVTMLVTMPFRALAGYFTGQISSNAFSIVTSVFALRKELSVKAEPYWTKPVIRRLSRLFLCIGLAQGSSVVLGLVEQTILRQHLPDVESAAYYMVTRFSDIASFVSTTLLVTLFPYTSEMAERGKSTRPLVVKTWLATGVVGAAVAVTFGLFGRPILSLLPNGEHYAPYWWAIPWLTMITTMLGIQTLHTNTEISAGRFGFLKWWLPFHVLFPMVLLFVTGYGYFASWLPEGWVSFLQTHNIRSLDTILWWLTAEAVVRVGFSACDLIRQPGK